MVTKEQYHLGKYGICLGPESQGPLNLERPNIFQAPPVIRIGQGQLCHPNGAVEPTSVLVLVSSLWHAPQSSS